MWGLWSSLFYTKIKIVWYIYNVLTLSILNNVWKANKFELYFEEVIAQKANNEQKQRNTNVK